MLLAGEAHDGDTVLVELADLDTASVSDDTQGPACGTGEGAADTFGERGHTLKLTVQ
jgi:hypothetical protein